MFQVKHHEELVGSSESFFISLCIRMRKIECPLPDPTINSRLGQNWSTNIWGERQNPRPARMTTKPSEAGKHQRECWGQFHHTGHCLMDGHKDITSCWARGLLSHTWCLQKGCTTLGQWARGQERWHLCLLLVNVRSFWLSPTSGRGYQSC